MMHTGSLKDLAQEVKKFLETNPEWSKLLEECIASVENKNDNADSTMDRQRVNSDRRPERVDSFIESES